MRLIEPDQRNFDEICASFRWEIPTHYNIAYEVCDKHERRSNDIALFYENDRGDTFRHESTCLKVPARSYPLGSREVSRRA